MRMALSEEVILQQINVLTKKTSENPNMTYKSVPALNTGLDPTYFSGNDTKVVNAINKIAKETAALNLAVVAAIKRINEIISDTGSETNREVWEKVQELMEADNILEGMQNLLEGKLQDKVLNLHPADEGKILSVTTNKNGELEVKPVSVDSLTVEVGAYDVAYLNRDLNGVTNIGEAIDVICENRIDNITMSNDFMSIMSPDNKELASVPMMNDNDIMNIISSLDME
jgi:hypothetical protein